MAAMISQSHRAPPAVQPNGPTGLPLRRLAFPALGTMCEIQYVAQSDRQASDFERTVVSWVNGFEARYSRFRPDSLIGRINAAAGKEWVEVDAEMEGMLKLCDSLHFMTQGIMDPTTLPLMKAWDYRAENPRVPEAKELDTARTLVGWKKLQRAAGKVFLPAAGMALDFGGFGKEYAVDFVAQLAADRGISAALVDFGHDLRALGMPPGRPAWHIGLEDPERPGATRGSLAITNRGVASSGDYIRCFVVGGKRYGHIIDPRTGCPVSNGCTQATVVASSCLQAGVLSTTAFVLGVSRGIEFIQSIPGAEGLIVTSTTRAQTRGFFQYVASN